MAWKSLIWFAQSLVMTIRWQQISKNAISHIDGHNWQQIPDQI